ncbi:MAG: site-specific integrase, partial [Xanthomonadales bacterium]|nr:site-specific integrase [Xanthomonadales bacterium]
AQLRAYTEHLVALDELTDGKLTSWVRDTLAGTRPMFFALNGALEPTELDISAWRQRLPEEWRRLPQNCGRANICTRATEAGAPFDLVLTHLGHLEAASFPFSDAGPTEPVLFAERLAPILNEMAVSNGWRIRRGLRSTRNQPSIWEQAGPVRDWRPTLQAHDAQMQSALRDVRHAQRAALRLERRRGEEIAALVLRQFAPRIATAAENDELQRVDISSIEMIDADGLRMVESEIKTLSQGNVAITIAATRALNKTLRVLTQRKWAGVLPAQWWPLHRPIATPFFPGMMAARAQIQALRMAFGEMSDRRELAAVDSPATDFARAALALVLFGFQQSADRVCEILANRHTARRIASLPDMLLVQISGRDVVALSGVAAVALARLRKRQKLGDLPPRAELDREIAGLMPPGAISPGVPTLDRLASLVAVTNRVELSGIARLALDLESGCVSARMDRQVAFFDGDPPGTAVSLEKTASPAPLVESVLQPRRVGESRPQYLQLVKLVSTANNKTIVLTRSNKEVTPANYETSRGAIAAEIDAMVKDKETNAVVAALGFWTAHMLRHGTERTPNPAYATIHTYLTSVGDKLVEYTGGTPLSDLDELELTEVCIDIVESKPELARARTARELMAFLDVVSEPFDLEPIDTSELKAYLPAVERSVDAEIILPTECSWAIDLSGASASFEIATRTPSTASRLSRRRHIALRLIAAASARSGEVLGARHRDLHLMEGRLWLKIAPNRNRRIKTPAGRRIVDVTAALDATSGFDVMTWSRAEQQRWPEHERHNAYLFATLDGSRDLGQKSELRGAVAEILAQATTRPRERPHRLRGLGASIRIIKLYLPSILLAQDGEVPADVGDLDVLTPRDLARIAITLGHANIRTTLLSYFPFPWVLRARSDRWIGRWLTPETAATALGISAAGAIKVRQRRGSTSTSCGWLDHSIAPRAVPTAVERPVVVDANAVEHPLTVREIGCLLGWTERGASIANATLTIGASSRQLEATHLAAREFEAKTGCGLLRGDKSESSKAIARRFGRAAHLYRLWEIADRPVGDAQRKQLDGLVESIFALAAPDARNVLRLSKRDLPVLTSLLESVGHSPALIAAEYDRRDLFALVDVNLSTSPVLSGTRHLLRIVGAIWITRRQ